MMIDTDKLLFNTKLKIAVVGASNNPDKFGYKVYKQLKEIGYEVVPINPREELIQGDNCYDNLYTLGEYKVDLICFIVPPDIANKVTQTAIKLGYKYFWYQPGSFDSNTLLLNLNKDINIITTKCILIETARLFNIF
jgi:uncharacterized protein